MRRPIRILALLLLLIAFVLGTIGYFLAASYLQSLLANVATTLLGLAVALFLVNYYLASSEKAEAAAPLVKLINRAIGELHNDLFVRHWNNQFGIAKAKELLAVYDKNKRNRNAFSPDQRDQIHAAIMTRKDDLLRVYDVLIDQFRELSMITGWSFDPAVTAAALEARLNFVKFKSLCSASDPDSKSQIIEAYLDGEAAASAVFQMPVARLGLGESEWKKDV